MNRDRSDGRPAPAGAARWDRLFTDLEAQVRAEEAADLDAEVRDRTRAEVGAIRLAERMHAGLGFELTVVTAGGPATGRLTRVGADWCLLAAGGSEWLVALPAVVGVMGLGITAHVEPGWRPADRLSLTAALRELARDRTPVTLVRIAGGPLTGTVERAGADFLDLAVHPVDVAPRAQDVQARLTVPLAAVCWLSRRSG